MPFDPVPILVKQRPLDRIASEPEVVVSDSAFRQHRLSCGQRSRTLFPSLGRQGEKPLDGRADEAGPRLVGNLTRRANQRQGFYSAAIE